MIIAGIIVAVIVIIVGWAIGMYNSLIKARNNTDYTWAQIDVILKKRFDLVPQLVEAVKGYAAHEKETLSKVIEARQMVSNAGSVAEQAQANNMLTGALKTLFAVAEAYPELKANTNFLEFQRELTEIEDKIAYQRQFYNDSVYAYNTMIQQFPAVIIANMFHFTVKDMFNTETGEERQPVNFKF